MFESTNVILILKYVKYYYEQTKSSKTSEKVDFLDFQRQLSSTQR